MEKVLKNYKDVESGFHNTFSLVFIIYHLWIRLTMSVYAFAAVQFMYLFYRMDERRVRLMRNTWANLYVVIHFAHSVSLIGGLIWLYTLYVVRTVLFFFTHMDTIFIFIFNVYTKVLKLMRSRPIFLLNGLLLYLHTAEMTLPDSISFLLACLLLFALARLYTYQNIKKINT